MPTYQQSQQRKVKPKGDKKLSLQKHNPEKSEAQKQPFNNQKFNQIYVQYQNNKYKQMKYFPYIQSQMQVSGLSIKQIQQESLLKQKQNSTQQSQQSYQVVNIKSQLQKNFKELDINNARLLNLQNLAPYKKVDHTPPSSFPPHFEAARCG